MRALNYSSKTLLLLICLTIPLLGSACKTTEYWTFGATRNVLIKHEEGPLIKKLEICPYGEGTMLLLAFSLPIDVLMLPIAIPHDIWLYNNNERIRKEQNLRRRLKEKEINRGIRERLERETYSVKPWVEEDWPKDDK
jgi:hypothetical protein